MTFSASIAESLANNALSEALETAKTHVKAHPSDKEGRHVYIDLLVLRGDYERADAQCNVATRFAPEDTMGFAMLRNQLRAMAARQAWFSTGAIPEFPQGPSECDKAGIQLNIAHRASEADEASAALKALEQLRGEQPMIWNGKAVADFRDLDDRIPHALEVIMTGGAYLWIDFSKIASVTVEPIARPRDLAFRRAELALTDGAAAPVLLPAIYHGTEEQDKLVLGRETKWVKEASGITTGRGQRCFLAGDALVALHDAQTLQAALYSEERQAANG